MDISCQYLVSLFVKGNAFARHELKQQGELFTDYARKLNSVMGSASKTRCIFLEADTSKEGQNKLSVFYNMEAAYMEKVLPGVLLGEGYPNMTKRVVELEQMLQPYAALWHIGCMPGRKQKPLRLVLAVRSENLATVLKLLAVVQSKQIMEQISQLDALGVFAVNILDIDLLPNGDLGPIIGVELAALRHWPHQQQALFQQPAYAQFKQLLVDLGVADARIHTVERCVLSMTAEDKTQYPYHIYAGVSHYKLQWEQGQPLPAKAYLRLRPVALEANINKSLEAFQF